MNLSQALRNHYVFPSGGFAPFPRHLSSYARYARLPERQVPAPNRPGAWQIHGATHGVVYWAFPPFAPTDAPRQIMVRVPDQSEWPAECWDTFDARESAHMSDARAANLGIARHLATALQLWSTSIPDFEAVYKALPYGSWIQTTRITPDPAEMTFSLVPSSGETMLPWETLKNKYQLAEHQTPPVINVADLHFVQQLQGSIALVALAADPQTQMILKTKSGQMRALYHELYNLLTLEAHPNVLPRPSFVATTFSRIHQADAVCGFLIPFYATGALDSVLPARRADNTLMLRDQTRWAKEVTAALMHVQSSSTCKYYPDLKSDNVLIAAVDGCESVVLADFEQGRNFHNNAAPEMYYLEWVAELSHPRLMRSHNVPANDRQRFSRVLQDYLASKHLTDLPVPPSSGRYDHAPMGWYYPFLLSSPAEQEAAHVYMLGKLLWCIFEGVGDADNVIGRSLPQETERFFPDAIFTPEPVRALIYRCTAGAREWKGNPVTIVRRGGVLYPRGRTGRDAEPVGTLDETKTAIRTFWRAELDRAESFLAARARYNRGTASDEDVAQLDFLRRPTLQQVYEALDAFHQSLV